MLSRISVAPLLIAGLVIAISMVRAQDSAPLPLPDTLELHGRQWKVSGGAAPGYLPDRACAPCHRKEWESYRGHGMGRSFHRPRLDDLMEDLSAPPFFHEKSGLHYQVFERDGALIQKRYRVDADGQRFAVREEQIDWVVGSGNHSRSYLYQTDVGELYELPLVWYSQNEHWGMAPGFDSSAHLDFNRRITRECLFCHNGFPDVPAGNDLPGREPYFPAEMPEGIGCQRCHGPGARHAQLAAEMADAEQIRTSVVNPAQLEPERRDDVCHQCHLQPNSRVPSVPRVFDRGDYSYQPGQKLADFIVHLDLEDGRPLDQKFETNHHPYRLRQSRCYEASDGQLHCLTCHDPHRKISPQERAAHYRAKCLSCHEGLDACGMVRDTEGKGADGAALDMNNLDCTQCHMPERRPEDAVQTTVTDHRIRRDAAPAAFVAPMEEKFHGITDARLYFPEDSQSVPQHSLYPSIALLLAGHGEQLAQLHGALATVEPRPLRPTLLVAAALRRGGQPAEALKLLDELATRHPGRAVVHGERGFTLLAMKRIEEAEAALRKTLTLDARDADVHFALGRTVAARGDSSEAQLHYERAIARRPHHTAALYHCGMLELNARRVANAHKFFTRAVASDSTHGDGYEQLGWTEARQHQWSAAIRTWRQGLQVIPEHPGMLEGLATVLLICPQSELQNAEAALEVVLRLNGAAPTNGQSRLLQAMALLVTGRNPESSAALEKARQLGADTSSRLLIASVIEKLADRQNPEAGAQTFAKAMAAKEGTRDTPLRVYLETMVSPLFKKP